MKALFSAEIIGGRLTASQRATAQRMGLDVSRDRSRPWVAEITGLSAKYGYRREFLRGRDDWTNANSQGTRGVRLWWTLESGTYYEAYYRLSWKDARREFLKVETDGRVVEIEQEEVDQWLQERMNVSRIR